MNTPAVRHQSSIKSEVPGFRSELDSGQRGDNSFAGNRPEFAQLMANRISGVQIPAARCEFRSANRFHRTNFSNEAKFTRAAKLNPSAKRMILRTRRVHCAGA